jgi:hypothetical protein
MKKFIVLAIIALSALGLTGCVQVQSDTVIEKDGSGTASLAFALSPGMADAIKEMEELGMNEGQDVDVPKFDEINRADLEEAAKGHGVKITRFEKTEGDTPSLDIGLEFEDLESLSYVMASIMGGEPGQGMGIYEAADGNFILKAATYEFPDEPVKPAKEAEAAKPEDGSEAPVLTDEEKAQKQMALYGKMMGAIAELDVQFTVTVPGEVIESNAPTVEGTKSIWAINSGNMMNMQDDNMEPVITFSSEGLDIEPLKEDK